MAQSPYLNISDLTGGINDADSPFSIEPNQVTEAKNLDFRAGRIGTKRNGMEAVSLSNSVFARARPQLATTNKGGFATAVGTVNVSAFANTTDASGNQFHFLVVFIANNAPTNITSVTLGATPLTAGPTISNGAGGKVAIYYLAAPSLAGGVLTVTQAGAADCAVIAQRWREVDPLSPTPPAAAGQLNGADGLPTILGLGGPTYVVVGALSTTVAAGTPAQPLVVVGVDNQIQGTATLWTQAQVGSIIWQLGTLYPGGVLTWTMTPALWSVAAIGLLGRNDLLVGTLGATVGIRALIRHTPTNDPTQDELWAQDNFGRLDRYVGGVWQGGIPVQGNNINLTTTGSYHTNGVSLHGKLFLALLGNYYYDRMVVWDGNGLRWAGSTAPTTAPTAINSGVLGTITGTRYYRYRLIETSVLGGTVVIRRSEPSPVVAFTPSGVNNAVLVNLPPFPGTFGTITGALDGQGAANGENGVELEASTDNVLFYQVFGPQPYTITGFTDATPYAGTGTYTAYRLSENIGEYVAPTAPRHVAVDQDRLMMAGSPNTPLNDSRVSWTPVRADTGVGNDERVPITARFFQDLDGLSGGNITQLVPGMMGGMYAFKLQRIYKLTRTGSATRAYDVQFESASRGALMRAARLSSGINGAPLIYFVDPNVGLCAYSDQGVEDLMQTRRTLATRINKLPSVLSAKIVVFSKQWIVWVWVALDGAVVPNYGLAYNIRTRGWTDITGGFANIVAAVPCFTTIGEVPYVATSVPRTSYICESDTTATDDGLPFRAWITTKPMQLGQLYRKFGIQAAVLHAKAAASTIGLALIRNFGLERKDVSTSIAAVAAETYVIRPLDDARMSESHFIQFELGDPVTYAGAQLNQTWTLDELAAKLRSEDESTS